MPEDQQTNNEQPQRPQIFSDQFIAQIGEDLANQIIDQICKGITQIPAPQPATSLCLELIVFDLDEDILEVLVECIFDQFNPVLLTQKILNLVQRVTHLLNGNGNTKGNDIDQPKDQQADPKKPEPDEKPTPPTLVIDKFELLHLVNKKICNLQSAIQGRCHLQDAIFDEILLHPRTLPSDKLNDLYFVTEHVIIQEFRNFLVQQYDNFALKLCNKVSCLQSDLEFLGTQIKQVTINFPAAEKGIIEIADAAASVARAFFSEEDDFDEIFDAVDQVSELIEDLAQIYEHKLNQLDELLFMASAGCPLPIEARETLPTIPEVPPPPPIFPVVGLGSASSLSSLLEGL